MNQRKINTMRTKLGRLARNQCANYKIGGSCDLQRCGLCTVEIKTDLMPGNICPYFMRNVLPADPALMREYLKYLPADHPLRNKSNRAGKCKRCGQRFERRSNWQQYCAGCAVENEKENSRRRNRDYRDRQRKRMTI
ncbi:hypothetical protein [Bacillus sp. FSL M8-0168]|uniref:hypothetical protein n=1 Tax=Bacillus sp. FSL M8-0168 TaxID=2921614 RepID=UPI0030FDC92D